MNRYRKYSPPAPAEASASFKSRATELVKQKWPRPRSRRFRTSFPSRRLKRKHSQNIISFTFSGLQEKRLIDTWSTWNCLLHYQHLRWFQLLGLVILPLLRTLKQEKNFAVLLAWKSAREALVLMLRRNLLVHLRLNPIAVQAVMRKNHRMNYLLKA